MASRNVKFTIRDYMNIPPGERYQLLNGELVLSTAPNDRHQRISIRFIVALYMFVLQNSLGEIRAAPYDVILAEDAVVQPDILFVSNNRIERIDDANCRERPTWWWKYSQNLRPALTGGINGSLGYKRELYGRCGVLECWMVHPDARLIEILTLNDEELVPAAHYHSGETLVSPLLPGLAIDLTPSSNKTMVDVTIRP